MITGYSNTLFILLLGSVRVLVVLILAPFYSANGLPRRAFVSAIVMIVVPMIMPTLPKQPLDPLLIAGLVVKEAFLGTLIGFFISIPFWSLEAAGELMDLQRGTTAGEIFNPTFGGIESPLGGFFLRLSGYFFYAIGGFVLMLGILFTSYQLYPITEILPPFRAGWHDTVFPLLTEFFRLGVLYAAPVLIIFFFTDFGLGLINRFVPQLNIFFFSLPIKSALCFLMLVFYAAFLLEAFRRDLYNHEDAIAFLRSIFRS